MIKPFDQLDDGERKNILQRFEEIVQRLGEPKDIDYRPNGTYIRFSMKDGLVGCYKW